MGGRRNDRIHKEEGAVTGYTHTREKTKVNDHSLCDPQFTKSVNQ